MPPYITGIQKNYIAIVNIFNDLARCILFKFINDTIDDPIFLRFWNKNFQHIFLNQIPKNQGFKIISWIFPSQKILKKASISSSSMSLSGPLKNKIFLYPCLLLFRRIPLNHSPVLIFKRFSLCFLNSFNKEKELSFSNLFFDFIYRSFLRASLLSSHSIKSFNSTGRRDRVYFDAVPLLCFLILLSILLVIPV